jgi:hypothetical protein
MVKVKELEKNYNNGFKAWHCNNEFSLNKFKIRCSDMVGGCGASNLYKWVNYENAEPKDILEVLQYIEDYLLSYDVGIIFCQVGKTFYDSNFCKVLEELEYKYIKYINPRHGDDTQRMYYKDIN